MVPLNCANVNKKFPPLYPSLSSPRLKEEVKEYMKRVVSALADLANETD